MKTARPPVAVIDLGSNSARVCVFRVVADGVLDVLADEHVPLQLIRAIDDEGRIADAAIERAVALLRDFRRLAESAGATGVRAYGTAAIREAANGAELVRRAKAGSGVALTILDGRAEGRVGFLGAVHALPVRSGVVFDIGGGSLQVTRFHNRRMRSTCSLPLGALRVSDEFLRSDPPSGSEVKKLRAHVQRALKKAKVHELDDGERVVGTGGTVRNLAKVDSRRFEYPIPRLHGYGLTLSRLRELTSMFTARDSRERTALPGLNRHRADSIVGGAIVATAVLEACGAKDFLVAGQGMREGVVLAGAGGRLGAPERVREASVAAFAAGIAACDPQRAKRRTRAALSLYDQLEPYPDATWREMLAHASALFDAGRVVDYYRLHTHTAAMVRSSGLAGFSHRGIALVSSMVEMADRDGWDPHRCSPPLGEDDYDALERAGVLLCLADLLEQRRPPGPPSAVAGRSSGREFVIRDEALVDWEGGDFPQRFRAAFGLKLKFGA